MHTQIPAGLGGPVVGDFFKDGKLSLAVTTGVSTVSVLHGNGDGTFQAPIDYLVGFHGTQPSSVIAGDFNGDGKLDLAVTNTLADDVSVLLNTTPPVTVTAPVGTVTKLATDINPAVFGQAVTLTVTVTSSSGTPTGTVTFFDGSTVLDEVALDPNGQATLTVQLGVVVHSLRAVFAGTGPFTASTSATLAETVNRAASKIILSLDTNVPILGPILGVTVVSVAPGAGVPSGTVSLLDGSTVVATFQIDGTGQTSFRLDSLPSGTHTLTVSYSGDENFLTSISDRFKVTL
jgi:hypothetical protein